LLLNSREGFGRQNADRGIPTERLFQGSHLVAFRPAIKIQIAIALLDWNAHAEFSTLSRGQSYDADIQSEPIDRIN
jgi:hypothetical protein